MPGRPRSFDRSHAVTVARDAFWRDGYDATSISELTRMIGISPPSLYAAFGDKEGLFDEAAQCYLEATWAGFDEAMVAPSTREAIANLLRVTARAHADPATPPGCLMLSEPRLAGERERMRAAITARFSSGREAGELPADSDPERLSALVMAVMSGMSQRARDGAGVEELLGVAELALAAIPGA